ncbi:hypothetical protein TCAL_05616 [Tigriopus californicus]|uniref:AN1-type domain-containing protein n=1 Tax=Tigriopus californicus TaxID=6832 RepID=A0A553NUT3_TIGCA|nr:AN1-type zinc finger protein 2A-like [Tigriopus californicus]TRY69180.1 hypothetical protein TCAL_05616 [Tigriopus californicus]|eukprot:TCALIF_05616-PA protein Name:"Similar to ZFAND2B AN1-type zinc finger protein 2B (Homo sapiens)" AED:0.02 eAED:0.02 QI:312/1/1/1/1/1/2/234/257
MELPDLGQHCGWSTCSRLDFLPFHCHWCGGVFCQDHGPLDSHHCPQRHERDVKVPVCPLCQLPCPVRRDLGHTPDFAVNAHIDRDCQSDKATRQRRPKPVDPLVCVRAKCKKKELVPLTCDECRRPVCLTHRHPEDHACPGSRAGLAQLTSAAASRRATKPVSAIKSMSVGRTSTNVRSLSVPSVHSSRQLSEDEALARALQASLNEGSPSVPPMDQTEIDRLTALSLQESLNTSSGSRHPTATQSSSGQSKGCSLS